MTSNNTSRAAALKKKPVKRTIAEKMAIAEELRDLQEALAPLREANRAKRAGGKWRYVSRLDEFDRLSLRNQLMLVR